MLGRRREGGPKGGLVRSAIRGISGGIGLASESIKAHKAGTKAELEPKDPEPPSRAIPEGRDNSKRAEHDFNAPPPGYYETQGGSSHSQRGPNEIEATYPAEKAQHENSADLELENEWNLDDAQDQIVGGPSMSEFVPQGSELEDSFLLAHGSPNHSQRPVGRLSAPVILPQRRPKDRSRGFIRAYAPALNECGIDQPTWLDFLDNFQRSSAASPWINAINLAGFATLAIPTPGIGLAVGYAIRQATALAMELQGRERTSKFLQKINEEFFQPRGLFCLVLTWNPASKKRVEQVNLAETIASRSKPRTGLDAISANYRNSDGKTYGEYNFPEVAPLVFPALDQLAAQTSEDGIKKKNNMAKGMTFVANYWDKRATAQYAMTNPDSLLASVPAEKFASRYADPNSAAASGSLIAFVSGGHLVPNPGSRGLVGGLVSVVGQAVRGERQGSGWDEQTKTKYNKRVYNGPSGVEQIFRPVAAYKKLIKQNVLYLMVVNMPSEEDMAAAKAMS